MQIEAIPLQRLQQQQATLQSKMDLYGQFKSQLQLLSGATLSLNNPSTFNPMKATSSTEATATITTSASGGEGTYALSVYQLAQAQKISSIAQTDATTQIGSAGSFTVNGKTVTYEATDTMTSIASKINGLDSGVTASIINGGSGQTYLTMTAKKSGVKNQMVLADTTGTLLSNMGLTTTSVRSAITNGAKSYSFDKADAKLTDLLDFSSLSSMNLKVNGVDVAIDPATETLTSLASKISATVPGVTASVVSSTEMGRTTYHLEVAGSSTPTFGTEGDVFTKLGILKHSGEIVTAQDAKFSIDGVGLSNSTNTVTDVVAGSTITLLKANASTPETTTLSLNRDTDAVAGSVKAFADAYNKVIAFIRDNTKFDKESFAAGPLFGDNSVSQVESAMAGMVFQNVSGLATYKNLSSLGFSFGSDGTLAVDEAKLKTALAADPTQVGMLFRATGTTSSSLLTYVSSTSKTKSSGAGTYGIEITQAATLGAAMAAASQSSTSTSIETLTFNGKLFNDSPVTLALNIGNDLSATINQINNDSKLKDYVTASNVGGKLVLTSKRYGSTGNFTVQSDKAAAADNSGVGTTKIDATGKDVKGKINNKDATGSGQFLTAPAGSDAEGLSIQYTGSADSYTGTVAFTKGTASLMHDLMDTFVTGNEGLLNASTTSLQSQYDDIGRNITSLQSLLDAKQLSLKTKFANMEAAISSAQSQAQRLTAMLGAR